MTDEDPLRGSGRSIGLMLVAIGTALLKPDEWIEFRDHDASDRGRGWDHAGAIKEIARDHGLTIDVRNCGDSVRLRSPFAFMKANRDYEQETFGCEKARA